MRSRRGRDRVGDHHGRPGLQDSGSRGRLGDRRRGAVHGQRCGRRGGPPGWARWNIMGCGGATIVEFMRRGMKPTDACLENAEARHIHMTDARVAPDAGPEAQVPAQLLRDQQARRVRLRVVLRRAVRRARRHRRPRRWTARTSSTGRNPPEGHRSGLPASRCSPGLTRWQVRTAIASWTNTLYPLAYYTSVDGFWVAGHFAEYTSLGFAPGPQPNAAAVSVDGAMSTKGSYHVLIGGCGERRPWWTAGVWDSTACRRRATTGWASSAWAMRRSTIPTASRRRILTSTR